MPNHRALIVDDSRSARHILGRMLEGFGLEVDAVESAELALTYLQTARPDVIFMDHLMPGMDGFAAVRVIKANPDTATIPVLMYTSQEGDMYLSQARALGAMGVLPKTLKSSDVAEVLQHLNLPKLTAADAARAASTPRTTAVAAPATPEREARQLGPPVEVLDTPADAQVETPAIPISMSPGSIPQLAHRIAAEVQAEMTRTYPPQAAAQRIWRTWAWVATVLVVLLGVVIYQQHQIQQQLLLLHTVQQPSNAAAKPAVQTILAPPPTDARAPATTPEPPAASPGTRLAVEEVAYGEVPLAGVRLERLRSVIEQLRSQQAKGVLRVEVFLGDFCLVGSAATGYELAADDLLASRCDLTSNPFGDALTMQQRQSVAFANLVASVNSNTHSGIKVQLADGAHKTLAPYPTPNATLTAATWNRIAERNQRVEFTLLAAP